MSRFAGDFFAQSPVLLLPLLALAIFMMVFVTMSVLAILMGKEDANRYANLPLSEEKDNG